MGVYKLIYPLGYFTGHPPQFAEEKIWPNDFVGRNYFSFQKIVRERSHNHKSN